jgi:hypothetical protein
MSVYLYLRGGTYQKLKALFGKLSEGAEVTDPFKKTLVGFYGALNDRFVASGNKLEIEGKAWSVHFGHSAAHHYAQRRRVISLANCTFPGYLNRRITRGIRLSGSSAPLAP